MKYLSKRTSVIAMLIGLLCTAAVGYIATSRGSDHPEPAAQAQKEANRVVIDNFKFQPRRLTVAAGTKVTWINRDDVPHTATSTAKPRAFDSKTLDTDEKYTHEFKTPGTYEYFCAVHPHMKAEIVVK